MDVEVLFFSYCFLLYIFMVYKLYLDTLDMVVMCPYYHQALLVDHILYSSTYLYLAFLPLLTYRVPFDYLFYSSTPTIEAIKILAI